MPFTDPIVADTTLVRDSIQSPDYVVGSTGWTINRDGTAEFNNIYIRGTIEASDVDGSHVIIKDDHSGYGAFVELLPASISGHTVEPAAMWGYRASSNEVSLSLLGPTIDGAIGSRIQIAYDSSIPSSYILINADEIRMYGELEDLNSWHAITPQNGWSNRGGNYPAFSVRRVFAPKKTAQLTWCLVTSGSTNGVIVGQVPTDCCPATYQTIQVAGAGTSPKFEIAPVADPDNSPPVPGAIRAWDWASGLNIAGNATYPLDI
jgi:hypothetical protein